MKRNLKIMGSKPKITDSEIQAFMNFDKLLQDQRAALENKRNLLIRNSLIATGILATTIIAILLISEEKRVNPPESASIKAIPHAQTPSKTAPSDSVAEIIPDPKVSQPARLRDEKVVPEISIQQTPESNEEKKQEENPGKKEAVYTQAEPVDGFPSLYEYFRDELKYPEGSLKDSIEGVVTVIFSIDTNGRPQNLQIENSLGESFDQEVKRVITNMPPWKPATYNGTPLNSKVSVPLTFSIDKIEK